MPDLGTFLSTLAGRPIRDKTGLTDKYDVSYQLELPPSPQEGGAAAPVAPDFFSSQIFTIVRDQLGSPARGGKGNDGVTGDRSCGATLRQLIVIFQVRGIDVTSGQS